MPIDFRTVQFDLNSSPQLLFGEYTQILTFPNEVIRVTPLLTGFSIKFDNEEYNIRDKFEIDTDAALRDPTSMIDDIKNLEPNQVFFRFDVKMFDVGVGAVNRPKLPNVKWTGFLQGAVIVETRD